MEKAYQHASVEYRLEDWLKNSTFLAHYMRDGSGKLATWRLHNWGSLSMLCQRLKGVCSTCLGACRVGGAQAGSPSAPCSSLGLGL